jgi:predicted metal-dependent hydrolase
MADIPSDLQEQVDQAAALQQSVENRVKELKSDQERIDETWAKVKETMVANNIKSIKGSWGSITIAERINWDYDPTMLAAKFFKKVVDTKKLSDAFKLEGKEPKGATVRYSKYLTKRLK